jgi:cytochrome c5
VGSRVLRIAREGVEGLVRHVTHGTRAMPDGQPSRR